MKPLAKSIFCRFPRLRPEHTETESINHSGQLVNDGSKNATADWASEILTNNISLDHVEATLMRQAMEQANQNVSGAARLLGLTRPAFAYRLKIGHSCRRVKPAIFGRHGRRHPILPSDEINKPCFQDFII